MTLATIAGNEVRLRPSEDGDTAYILATWLRSHAETYPSRERIAAIDRYRAAATAFLAEHGAHVACSPDHPSTIHGWACAGAGRLHYVYVPLGLRGHGLARALITGALGGYPESITTTRRWPRPSSRFVLAAATAAA